MRNLAVGAVRNGVTSLINNLPACKLGPAIHHLWLRLPTYCLVEDLVLQLSHGVPEDFPQASSIKLRYRFGHKGFEPCALHCIFL